MNGTKSKDIILVELYDAQEVRMVAEYLTAKQNRRTDRDRKDRDNKAHLRMVWERRMERWWA